LLLNPLSRNRQVVDKDGMPAQLLQLFSEAVVEQLKNPTFSNGVKFGNTVSSDADTINFFHKGSFLPIVVGVTTAGTAVYTNQIGTYQRLGDSVTGQITLSWTGHTGTGFFSVIGLPYPSASGGYASVTCYNDGIPRVAGQILQAVIPPAMSRINFSFSDPAGGVTILTVPAATTILILNFSYEV